jgi:hypothetical protein
MSSNYKTKKLDDSDVPNEKPNEIDVEQIGIDVNKSKDEDNSGIKCEKSETNNEKDLNNSKVNTSKNLDDDTPKFDYEATIKWYKTAKFKKIAIISIISLVVIGLVVGLSVALTRKSGSDEHKELEPESTDQNITINIFKTSTFYFDSAKEETIKTVLNLDNNFRRLDERKKNKKINSKYLLVVESNENDYTGHVIILSRNESNGAAEKILDDSENIDNEKSFTGIMKFNFKEDGTITNRLLPKGLEIDPVLYNEINDIITALIPNMTKKRNLEEYNGDVDFDGKNNWKSKSMDGALGLDDDVLVNSKYQSLVNTTIKNGEIEKINIKKNLLIKNSDYEKTESKSDDETVIIGDKLNDDNTYNGLIDSIEIDSNEILIFKKEDKELLEKIKEKLKDVKFEKKSSSGLRVLSKQEYEEKLKLQNEYKKNLNNLRELESSPIITESTYSPLAFTYELFKTSALGLQISFRAKIEWIPSFGYIQYQIFYQRGSKTFEYKPEVIEIKNYGKVVYSYRAMVATIISYLKDQILAKLNDNYSQLTNVLENYLKSYETNLNSILDPLSTLFKTYFKTTLDKFKNDTLSYAKNKFENLYSDLNIISTLETLENSLNNGSQENLKQIISLTETALTSVINTHNSNLTNLKNDVITFIDNSVKSINGLSSEKRIGIDFYYRVKEIFLRIDVMMDSFNDNLADALDSEFLLLQTYVNDDIYMKQIDQLIDEVEVIWDIFKNNDILKETLPDGRADTITTKLENIRKKYENVKNKLLSKVQEAYNNFKNTKIRNGYQTIQTLRQSLQTKEDGLINLIKSKVKYITNYEIYNEDIKKITNIENEVEALKLKSYKTHITEKLDKITTESFLSTNTINNFKKEIEEEVNRLLENLKNNNDNYNNNFNTILNKFKDLSSSNNINNIKAEIKNKFSSNLKTFVTEYYKDVVNNGISKYSTLTEDIINNSLERYVSKPVELIEKIKTMTSDTEKNTENENNKLQNVVNEKMKIILTEVLGRIKNILDSEYNYIRTTNIASYLNTVKKITATGDFYNNTLTLIEELTNKTSDYLAFETSLGLKNTIQEQEEAVNSKITEIAENLQQKFYYLFCYVKDTLNTSCPNAMINRMDEYDQYYFQVSKLRDALNHLTLLQPFIIEVVSDDNLKDLSADTFVNLYKNGDNFDPNTVQGKIIDFLEVLKKQGERETKENVKNLKEVIKAGFTTDLSALVYKQFYERLFSEPKDLKEKFDLMFAEAKRISRNGYLRDVEIYKNISFYLDTARTNLEVIFNNTWKNYSNLLNEKKNELFGKLTFTQEFDQKLLKNFTDKIFKDIDDYRNELIRNMTAKPAKNCILLDNTITLIDIIEEAIDELKDKIASNTKENLTSGFTESLTEYKSNFDAYFEEFEYRLYLQYRNNYDNIFKLLTQNSSPSSSNKITDLTNETKNGFDKGINYCLGEFENLIEANSLTKSVEDNEKIESILNNIFSRMTFKIPNMKEKIDPNVEALKLTCDNELTREKDLFKDEILEYIKLGFNYTIKNFMNGSGKSYLDQIFLNDYDINIVPKLDYIKAQSEEIDYYMYLVVEGLNDISSYFTNSVSEVYYQLMNYINDGITLSEINAKLIKKIEQFKIDSADKIVEYFRLYTLEVLQSNSFLNILSEQVRVLLPTYVPYTLTLNFAIIYKDLLDSLYLKNLINKYQTNIINKREEIISELQNLRFKRTLQFGKLAQGNKNSDLSTCIAEHNKLNATLSKIDNKFTLDLTDNKKNAVDKVLLNSTVVYYLKKIPTDYNTVVAQIQSAISTNVKLNIDLSAFRTKIEELAKKIQNKDPSVDVTNIRTQFYTNLTLLLNDFEKNIKRNYSKQIAEDGEILPIDKRRRLDEIEKDVDIKIESIQAVINELDTKIIHLTQNIANSNAIIKIANNLNRINNEIDIQLITLDNTMETYLKYSRYYLKVENTLNAYQQNITRIYNEVENILQDFMANQSDNIRYYYLALEDYKVPYYTNFKPGLIETINSLMKYTSQQLIDYLKDESKNGTEGYNYEKKTDLQNLGALNTVLGSTRLYYSISIQNASLNWKYDLKLDKNNYNVNLNMYAFAQSEASITYSNEYYETSVGGTFGKGQIGLDVNTTFPIDRVFVNYYTKHENNTFTKTLYEITTLDSWGVCEDAVNCFVAQNEDFCPYIVRIEDGNKTIVDVDSNDLGYYKNSSIYKFTGYYENKLCTYANYFYEAEETKYEFDSSIYTTV